MWAQFSVRVGPIDSGSAGREVWVCLQERSGISTQRLFFFYWNIYTGKLTVSVQLHLQEISRRQTKAAIDKTQL